MLQKISKTLNLKGLKVMFINMPLRENAKPNTPPYGPALLAAILRNLGAEVIIVDLNAYRVTDPLSTSTRLLNEQEISVLLTQYLSRYGDQDIIGLSGLITTLRYQKMIGRLIRRLQTDSFLITGGGLATEFQSALFKWIPELDAVALGEGDEIIINIAQDIIRHKHKSVSYDEFSSFVGYIDNSPRCIYKGGPIPDLGILPLPAWDLLHEDINGIPILENYIKVPVWGDSATSNSSGAPFVVNRSMTMPDSRGCPHSCTFCYRKMQGGRQYRICPAQRLTQEAIWLIDTYQVDFIGFNSDNFMISRQRIKDLVPLLSPLQIRWGTHGRMDEAADIGNNLRRINIMAKMGCVYIGFGAESADPNILNAMKKGGFTLKNGLTTIGNHKFPTTMVEAVKAVTEVGIHGNCTWIMGWPGETLDQLKTSVAFIYWQEKYLAQKIGANIAAKAVNKKMFMATAYPGTELFTLKPVRHRLNAQFGINFNPQTKQPIFDDAFESYVIALDDATKLLIGNDNKPLNYSGMTDDILIQTKEYIESDQIFRILDM